MTPDEFRREGRRMIEWIATYMERAGEYPVRSCARPGDVAALLPDVVPETGEGWDAIFADLDRVVVPGVTHWQSPRFFGYFPANASGPAILGELLSAGLGVQGMLWSTSPACTEIETRALDWLGRLVGLPDVFLSGGDGGGVIQGTASEAVLVAMVAARERVFAAGGSGELVAYTSSQAHSSIVKASMVCGVGRENVRLVGVDDGLRMRADELARLMREDAAAGRVPFFVATTVGTTSSGAVDPLAAICEIAGAHGGVWVHVDAAWAGSALVLPEERWMIEGVEHADSFNFNPHKWLLTNFDCSALWVRDSRTVVGAMSITPEYLRNAASDSGGVIDYRDWQVPLGRRFRALKLWFVLRAYGAEGLREHVRKGIGHAELFEGLVRGGESFEVVGERSLSLVCFAHKGGDAVTRAVMERVNDSGEAFLTHTALPMAGGGERVVIRFAAGGVRTTGDDVRRAYAALERAAAGV